MKYKNLTLIGTSHIAKESITEITNVFKQENPDIVTIELDRKRLYALLNKKKNQKRKYPLSIIFRIGFKGYIFSRIGEWAEKKLGEHVGVSPGSDMMTAFKLAKENEKQVVLIDQDIEITLKKLSKAISWKEKWHFLVDLFKGFVLRKTDVEGFDLSTVPSDKLIEKMLKKTKKRYPNIYKVLVTERNEVMAKRLAIIMRRNPDKKILATVGAGHEQKMLDIIKDKLNKIDVVYSHSFTIENTV